MDKPHLHLWDLDRLDGVCRFGVFGLFAVTFLLGVAIGVIFF